MARVRLLSNAALAMTLLLAGCQGTIHDPGTTGRPPGPGRPDEPVVCDGSLHPGRSPIRRLTVTEYDNTVNDLFGDTTAPASRLVDNERGVLSADARIVTPLLAEQYLNAAEDIAARLTAPAEIDALLDCDRATTGDDACARQLVERLVPRVYRRPAEAGEVDTLYALYEAGRDDGGFEIGIQLVLEAMLQSPSFLYRVEIVPLGGEPVVRLGGYELATRLSYFLHGTTPDETLFAAAAAGELDTAVGVEAHVRRMLEDPRADAAIERFFATYLELDHLEGLEKDPVLFPDYDENTAALFRRETEEFVREVVIDGDGSWVTLLTAPWSMMNAELASFYGVEGGPTGDAFERVELDPLYHTGLLTQASVTATRARTYETSPVHRGMFIRGTIMCGVVPNVPEGLEITLPEPDPTLTTRERFARHRSDPACASCHQQLDPLGFAFENFDAAGRFRATENDLPIDASGSVVGSEDMDGDFAGAPELARMITESPRSQACFAERWFPSAFGRADEAADNCTLDGLVERFAGADFDVRELVVALTLTDTFLYRVADQDSLTEAP
jgi:hypothetical protein